MGEFILMAKGFRGVYYISDGNKSDMERYLAVLEPLTIDQLKVVEYTGDDLEALKDDVELFNNKFENESFVESELSLDSGESEESTAVDASILEFDDEDEEDLLG